MLVAWLLPSPSGCRQRPRRRSSGRTPSPNQYTLVREPRVLLLDEPFGALDALTRLRMQDLFGRLRARHGFAAPLVTHDVDEALLLADRALVPDGGRIAEEIVIPLEHPRAPDDPGFGSLRRRLLDRLGVPLARGA
jgi:sulfonate transport system ATP-binding protein